MNHATFWSRYVGLYDRFMKKDAVAYREMIELIRTAARTDAPTSAVVVPFPSP